MTEGCPERITWQFFWWLVWTGRSKNRVQKFKNLQERYHDKITVLKNQRELDGFLKAIQEGLWQ